MRCSRPERARSWKSGQEFPIIGGAKQSNWKGWPVWGTLTEKVLARLAELDARQARVVELRCFSGLTVEERAEAMGIAARTVKLDWAMAKGWMQSQLGPRGQP